VAQFLKSNNEVTASTHVPFQFSLSLTSYFEKRKYIKKHLKCNETVLQKETGKPEMLSLYF